ncbi:hypothetical protein LOK49_LG09G01840 [Camellia lanceoleosa]|uniref:Uncharacterized protein n=1 Tax=Camellia lanceoleosa TaxID=1840588 RepID=A0ACC0GGT2_9ERIC|nr:hypothetical protein LOK49_LG09G01840 [Camellia lanceoleosa]
MNLTICVERIDESDNFRYCPMLYTVLPSLGIGSLSAREAEGRTDISSADKVHVVCKEGWGVYGASC